MRVLYADLKKALKLHATRRPSKGYKLMSSTIASTALSATDIESISASVGSGKGGAVTEKDILGASGVSYLDGLETRCIGGISPDGSHCQYAVIASMTAFDDKDRCAKCIVLLDCTSKCLPVLD